MANFDWFVDMFSAPSDRANFFAIIISSLLAVFTLCLNHYLIRRREKHNFIIAKLEGLGIKIYDCHKKTMALIINSKVKGNEDNNLESEIMELVKSNKTNIRFIFQELRY